MMWCQGGGTVDYLPCEEQGRAPKAEDMTEALTNGNVYGTFVQKTERSQCVLSILSERETGKR